MFTT
jgi:hypothetical protein